MDLKTCLEIKPSKAFMTFKSYSIHLWGYR